MQKLLENKIQLSWKKMTKKEQELSSNILDKKIKVGSLSIVELANELDTSISSINRWSKKLGFEGFKDMHANLKVQSEFISKYDDSFSSIQKDIIYSISSTEHFLNYDDLEVAANKINQLKRVVFYGEAFTYIISEFFVHLFNKIGISARVINIASELALINNQDEVVNIFVTISGRNPNILKAFNRASYEKKIFSVDVSASNNSIIGKLTNCSLVGDFYQTMEIDPFELPIISKTTIDFILQKLFLATYLKGDQTHYKKMIEQIAKEKI